ncbi:FAD-dependent oxidoreductase, partial [bacterium]|nr:FAD-dependent oxidoreductase [bacterium]
EDGGIHDLAAGTLSLALHDLTGFFARCDALVLTTDLDYTPPNDLDGIKAERVRLTGLSLEPKLAGQFDVIVVGAGAAGTCAAVAAARLGARTALVQNRPVLGGNASAELGVGLSGAANHQSNARESGLPEEVQRLKAFYGATRFSEPFRLLTENEKNLTVFLNQNVDAVEMASVGRIAAVRATDTLTGEVSRYLGKFFIDGTGDGWVGYYAGAEYRIGREARAEFNEDLAPETGDSITMSGCIMGLCCGLRAGDSGKPAPYQRPEWAPELPEPGEEFGRNVPKLNGGAWWMEHPGTFDDLWDAETARDELIRITFGYWDYVKNRWPQQDKAVNFRLQYVPFIDAKRESRRLIGDYILNQNDVQHARNFPDAVSYTGWPLDIHHPEGIYSGAPGPFDYNPHLPQIAPVPYRSLYSKNIENLFMAGRDMSVTHVALGTVRVQSTLATLGQAAGTAAAMCVKRNTTPRGIYENHIADLQQTLLKGDQYIIGLPNQDPADLARQAAVTASSVWNVSALDRNLFGEGRGLRLDIPRAAQLPWTPGTELKTLAVCVQSRANKPVQLRLKVRSARTGQSFGEGSLIAEKAAPLPPKAITWLEFEIDQAIPGDLLEIEMAPTPGAFWMVAYLPAEGYRRAWQQDNRWMIKTDGQIQAIVTDPAISLDQGKHYETRNAINGTARITADQSNLWVSDPTKGLPQWLELDFSKPRRFNTVRLTFDTHLDGSAPWGQFVSECVRDYEIQALQDGSWQTLAVVYDNFQRHRVHRFDPVTAKKVRLVVDATGGTPAARLFEIRVYDEPAEAFVKTER